MNRTEKRRINYKEPMTLHDFMIKIQKRNEIDFCKTTKGIKQIGDKILDQVLNDRPWRLSNPLLTHFVERQTLLTPSKITFPKDSPCLNTYTY